MTLDDEQVRIIKEFKKQGITTNATIASFLYCAGFIEDLLKIFVAQLKAAPNCDDLNIKNEVIKMGQFTLDKLLSELINMNIDNQENIEYLIEHLKPFIKIRNFVINRLHYVFMDDSTRAEFLIQSFFTLKRKIKTKIKSITDNMVFLDIMNKFIIGCYKKAKERIKDL